MEKEKKTIDKELMFKIFNQYLEIIEKQDITWEDFAEFINLKYDLQFSSSAFRKRISSYLEAKEFWLSNSDQETKDKILTLKEIKLNLKIEENRKLVKELKRLKSEYVKNNELERLVSQFVNPSQIEIQPIEDQQEKAIENIFILSDLQCDGSGFTKEIYEFVYQKIAEKIEKQNLKSLYLWLNGDEIDNLLRTSALIDNKSFIIQIQEVQTNLANLIERLTQLTKVNFSIVNSNHNEMRLFGLRAGETKEYDITILILEYLKAYLKNNPNVNWLNKYETARDLNYNLINVLGYQIYQNHGDLKGISLTNSEQTFDKINRYFNYGIDYCIFGHYHHLQIKTIGRCPSGGNKMVIWVPALDPRMKKENETSLLLSSHPGFLNLEVTKNQGVTKIKLFNLPDYLLKY